MIITFEAEIVLLVPFCDERKRLKGIRYLLFIEESLGVANDSPSSEWLVYRLVTFLQTILSWILDLREMNEVLKFTFYDFH